MIGSRRGARHRINRSRSEAAQEGNCTQAKCEVAFGACSESAAPAWLSFIIVLIS